VAYVILSVVVGSKKQATEGSQLEAGISWRNGRIEIIETSAFYYTDNEKT
jgi:hypothetical protein